MADPHYYSNLRERFTVKRQLANEALEEVGFQIYESGSAFYVWARIPEGFEDAMQLNETLISRAGVAGVPGSEPTHKRLSRTRRFGIRPLPALHWLADV